MGIIVFIEKWQTLIGAFLGPFLAVILSGIAYFVGSKYKNQQERREAFRRTEIAITNSLSDFYAVRKQLRGFIGRLSELAISVRKINNDTAYALEEINFPSIKDIFVDKEAMYRKFRSYYLHNKLLIAYSGIESTNNIIQGLKDHFGMMVKKNEFLVALQPRPRDQQVAYAENLSNFVDAVEGFLPYIDEGIKTLTQCKVYNLKFLEKKKWFTWKHEGISLKYFKNNRALERYCKHLDCIDRIDKVIQKEVEKSIKEVEERI